MPMNATMAVSEQKQDWMTPDEFRAWYARLGLNQTDLSRRLDVPQATISRWLSGARRIEHGELLRRALEHLAAELEAERVPKRRRRRMPSQEGE